MMLMCPLANERVRCGARPDIVAGPFERIFLTNQDVPGEDTYRAQ